MQHLEKIFTETDTTYIAPNKYNLTFMVEQSFWHERYRLGTRINEERQNISFAPTPTPKIGAYFGWRWIFFIQHSRSHRQKPKRQIEERICFQPIQFTSWSRLLLQKNR